MKSDVISVKLHFLNNYFLDIFFLSLRTRKCEHDTFPIFSVFIMFNSTPMFVDL